LQVGYDTAYVLFSFPGCRILNAGFDCKESELLCLFPPGRAITFNRKMNAVDHVRKALEPLGKEEIRLLLEYIREWNTKPKLCHVAQFVLFQILSMFPPTEIVEVGSLLWWIFIFYCCLLKLADLP